MSVHSVAASGGVRPVNGSPFPTGTEPIVPAFSVDGTLLAIPNSGDDTVTVYRANGQDGNSQGQNNNN